MIPASKLKVEINEEALKNALERVALGLKVYENCSGQFLLIYIKIPIKKKILLLL